MSERLKLQDVRAIFRLVGEVRELGGDPQKWRPHMIRALADIMGAEVVVSSEVHCHPSKNPGMLRIADFGWGCDSSSVWQIHSEREESSTDHLWIAIAPGKTDDLLPLKPIRHMHAGRSFMLSQVSLPHVGTVDQLGLHHADTGRAFGPVQHKLVRLLHTELSRLWRQDALRKAQDPAAALPPRLQQTLESLCNGASEKEVSVQLGISRHTVHNYVKALHQRFCVSSRGELLAKLRRKEAGFTPTFTPLSPS